jgi:hypothetical protein
VDDDEKSLLEAMLHRLELIRQHTEQQVAALKSLYNEVGALRTDIVNLARALTEKK